MDGFKNASGHLVHDFLSHGAPGRRASRFLAQNSLGNAPFFCMERTGSCSTLKSNIAGRLEHDLSLHKAPHLPP